MLTIDRETPRSLEEDERDGALLVQTFIYDSGGYKELIIDIDGDDAAGCDAWRERLYACATARALGFEVLPRLARGDLVVEGSELVALEREALLLQDMSELFAARSGLDARDVARFADNIVRAAHRAIGLRGGVIIW
jgi:hypothetical protein